MPERQGQSANFFKAVSVPDPDRAFVSTDDEIELHGAEAAFFCPGEGMFEHEAGDTSALRRRRRHVSTIGDVIPASSLICT